MSDDLQDMLRISNAAGRDPRLVQGGGGNTSVKTDGGRLMYVKASGASLGELRKGRGYRQVDVAGCVSIVEDARLEGLPPAEREAEVVSRLTACCVDELAGRPSVETSLHAMLGRCVVHTHPSVVNGLLCAKAGKEALAGLFTGFDLPHLYVEYAGAGYTLARRIHAALEQYRTEYEALPEVIFLENHGLFVSTEDADRALSLTREVFAAVEALANRAFEQAQLPPFRRSNLAYEEGAVGEVAAAMRRFYSDVLGAPALVRFSNDRSVTDFLRMPQARELCQIPPLIPDQVVYCRDRPVWIHLPYDGLSIQERVTATLRRMADGADTPLCALVGSLGLFCAGDSLQSLEACTATMHAILDTLSVAARFGGPRGLDREALGFLRGWEVEQFRRRLAGPDSARQDLDGKVALVTGAGSGLGRGISLFLARKGMHVVLADMDEEAGKETARRAEQQGARRGALPVRVDVTSETAVRRLVYRAVCELGGLDLVVNCAGIAPAHSLLDFPLSAWRESLDLNLTGYFLVAREGARCLVRQGTGGSIINISSKTGLEPSQHNSAYNATKAGEIHVARGWALDLAEHGIRVNVVCPGNVFTESQIWNEDYIKAVARKRGIEPEEVIPYYVNLTALKQEITWDDVGAAVAFLAGPGAAKITGQTLVVDGGQVFVR